MATRCERKGQIEYGILEFEGREYVALGATVVGRSVTGYTRMTPLGITLTTWCGQTMLDSRCEIVERYWTKAVALNFSLTGGKFIVGYALGDCGMLFRGELLTNSNPDDAGDEARKLAEYFAELDAQDEFEFASEQWPTPAEQT